jgi:hypothetical protein
MLKLSQRDRDRLVVVREMAEGQVKVTRGAELMGLSRRQAQRLVTAFRREGDAVVVHKGRGRPPNNRKPDALRERVLARAQEPIFEGFGPTLLAEHLSRDPQTGPVNPHTLRAWMIAAGLWKTRKYRARHRKARPRRAAYGELIQWDSSEHAWFEERGPMFTLIKMHDDATNRLQMARFVPRDDGPSNRQLAIDYLERHGRPVAFYTDKAGHFGQWTRPVSSDVPLEERDATPTESIIRRALAELNVELILAHSPQAKGRVERNFGTSQDRLVKELRVAGISTLEEANRFLEEVYIPYWDERFAVEPAESRDAHRRLPKRLDLEALFADTLTRSVRDDFTIRYKNRYWQIPKKQARGIHPGHKVTIERRLDGSTRFRFERRYLAVELVQASSAAGASRGRSTSAPALASTTPTESKPRPAPPRPGPDHPWRKNGKLLAKPAALVARLRSTPAASQPALSTPSPNSGIHNL